MEYCYKIEYVDSTNCQLKVKYYVKDHENDVFQEVNVQIPVTANGTIVSQPDLHLALSNLVPKIALNTKYATIYDSASIDALNSLIGIEYNVDVVITGTSVESLIEEILNTNQ